MDSTRTAERGFALLEVLACVGLLAIASAATLGALAALARNAGPAAARDVALMIAENTAARARAAIAYASSPSQDGPALLADRSWGLHSGESDFVAGAQLQAAALCGSDAPLTVKLPVAVTYDAPTERLTIAVTYPRDPCRVSGDGSIATDDTATVTLGQTLAPSVYPPGQVVHRDVQPPARM
jgi:prepilin-type N-terminal cleavage/methylation domain-containing protein